VLDFTNISNVTCTLYGYPGVSLAGGQPVSQVGLAASEDPTTPRKLVTLAPGQVASALLRIVDALNFPESRCGPVKTQWIQVYPPNQTTPIYLAYKTTGCSKPVRILSVSVVKAGSGGSAWLSPRLVGPPVSPGRGRDPARPSARPAATRCRGSPSRSPAGTRRGPASRAAGSASRRARRAALPDGREVPPAGPS